MKQASLFERFEASGAERVGINFIKVKGKRFSYERHFGSFSSYMYLVKAADSYEKFLCLTLMKLTTLESGLRIKPSLVCLNLCNDLH